MRGARFRSGRYRTGKADLPGELVGEKLGEEIFDDPGRPWRQTFLQLIAENPGATFYQADAGEGVIFLYCRDVDKGLWYLPGSGIGPLSEGGRQLMKEAIAAGPH